MRAIGDGAMTFPKVADLTGFRVLRNPTTRRLIGAVLAGEVAVAVAVLGYERATLRARQNQVTSKTAPAAPWLRIALPGVTHPAISKAEDSRLAGGEEVIGVAVAGRARAYRLSALAHRSRHVVNDVVDGTPVSVTYCDLSDCVRVYTTPTQNGPLDVQVAGLYGGQGMVVRLEGEYFLQTSGAPVNPGAVGARLPYDTLPATRTTWDEWRRLHPESDVYVGDRAE
ncbi:MAG: DUF3179 domain-containing (seleno)protein [Isosphaeraceae bacterium]|nr:DUF3179 domain-containing (seleno)protein [Isosphaeraceae bacterium]